LQPAISLPGIRYAGVEFIISQLDPLTCCALCPNAVYDAKNAGVWGANTQIGSAGKNAYALMQDDGNFVVYRVPGAPLWSSGEAAYIGR
jgi:hypothetical protein